MTSSASRILDLPWEKGNTSRFWAYLEQLGSPQNRFATVHVTGTNGKGSVAAKITSGLKLAGVKTGLFTSPHINDIKERIRIDGQIIDSALFDAATERAFSLSGELSFFEGITAVAFEAFALAGVDVAVLETGVGGTLCSTNCVQPLISVITSVSMDHEQYLGNTLASIARNKAGVIKPRTPVILGAKAQQKQILDTAKKQGSPTICGIISDGFFDDENTEIASLALQALKKYYPITDPIICEACKARPRSRFEVLPESYGHHCDLKPFPPFVVLDVAHNPAGFKALFTAISMKLPSLPIRSVISLCQDKPLKQCLQIVSENSAKVHVLSGAHPRLATTEQLLQACPTATPAPPLEELLKTAASSGEILLFAGSFYTMGAIRDFFRLPR